MFHHYNAKHAVVRAVRALSVRARIGIIVAAFTSLSLAGLALSGSASANTKSNWSAVVDSVEVGWTQDHAWLITSYANAIKLGSGTVAGVVCDAISDGGIGPVCDAIVEQVVAALVKNEPRLTNHGIWAAIYPEAWGRYQLQDGRY